MYQNQLKIAGAKKKNADVSLSVSITQNDLF